MYITFNGSIPVSGQPPCPECGMTMAVAGKTGRLGCPYCYTHFADRLAAYLRRIHGPAVHSGKIPKSSGETLKNRRMLTELKEKLSGAIAAQEFEECARLRDEINRLSRKEGEG